MTQYLTDLTEKQWQVIKNILESQVVMNRKHSLREIMNIIYVDKTNCQWRMLLSDFTFRRTVYYYFRKWKYEGLLEEMRCLAYFHS